MREKILKAIESTPKTGKKFRFYPAENFKDKQIKNAVKHIVKSAGVAERDVVAILDSTLFNSCKEGYVFTTEGFYGYRTDEGVRYSDIAKVEKSKKTSYDTIVTLKDGKKVTVFTSAVRDYINEILIKIVEIEPEKKPEKKTEKKAEPKPKADKPEKKAESKKKPSEMSADEIKAEKERLMEELARLEEEKRQIEAEEAAEKAAEAEKAELAAYKKAISNLPLHDYPLMEFEGENDARGNCMCTTDEGMLADIMHGLYELASKEYIKAFWIFNDVGKRGNPYGYYMAAACKAKEYEYTRQKEYLIKSAEMGYVPAIRELATWYMDRVVDSPYDPITKEERIKDMQERENAKREALLLYHSAIYCGDDIALRKYADLLFAKVTRGAGFMPDMTDDANFFTIVKYRAKFFDEYAVDVLQTCYLSGVGTPCDLKKAELVLNETEDILKEKAAEKKAAEEKEKEAIEKARLDRLIQDLVYKIEIKNNGKSPEELEKAKKRDVKINAKPVPKPEIKVELKPVRKIGPEDLKKRRIIETSATELESAPNAEIKYKINFDEIDEMLVDDLLSSMEKPAPKAAKKAAPKAAPKSAPKAEPEVDEAEEKKYKAALEGLDAYKIKDFVGPEDEQWHVMCTENEAEIKLLREAEELLLNGEGDMGEAIYRKLAHSTSNPYAYYMLATALAAQIKYEDDEKKQENLVKRIEASYSISSEAGYRPAIESAFEWYKTRYNTNKLIRENDVSDIVYKLLASLIYEGDNGALREYLDYSIKFGYDQGPLMPKDAENIFIIAEYRAKHYHDDDAASALEDCYNFGFGTEINYGKASMAMFYTID